MKIIFICMLFLTQVFASDEIIVRRLNGETASYSSDDYEVVKKEKHKPNQPIDYSTKKFLLKSNSISFYMGRGPTYLSKELREDGSTTYRLGQSNLYGIGLSQRLNESFHLEMIGLSNETFMSGLKFEFGSP